MYLYTFYFCWFYAFFWTQHRRCIPVFFSKRVGPVLDMITDYPWRQETRIIYDHDGYVEGFSEVFEDVFEVAYIACTCDDHANIMMLNDSIND